MTDYIDRDVAVDAFCSLADALISAKKKHPYTLLEETEIRGKISGIYLCKGIIRTTKPTDVAPVRHGKWIYHMDDLYPEESTMECSVCGDFIFIRGESDNYCPNCGAKMDGEIK